MPAISERQRMAHLYRRAGFGATPEELKKALSLGFHETVANLLHFEKFPDTTASVTPEESLNGHPQFTVEIGQAGEQTLTNALASGSAIPELTAPSPMSPQAEMRFMTLEERQKRRKKTRTQIELQRFSWLNRMIFTQRPLQEKLALFWHGHFATSWLKVGNATLMEKQINLFRQLGFGNFERLVSAVSKDPAMILWLDNFNNRKKHPNENYARELMELFTLGLGHYTETDVRQAARAFTGWSLMEGNELPEKDRDFQYLFLPRLHDFGAKTLLGETGPLTGEDVVRIVSRQPAAASFIAAKLFKFFAYDDPEPQVISALARNFMESDFNLRSLVLAIFSSRAFSSPKAYRAKIKGPVEYVVSAVKLLGGRIQDMNTLNLMARMGQILYEPPSVKGWDGGMAWLGTSSIFDRFNFATYLVWAENSPLNGGDNLWERANEDGARTVEDLVDYYSNLLLSEQLSQPARQTVINHVESSIKGKNRQAREIVRLILCSPEFQMA